MAEERATSLSREKLDGSFDGAISLRICKSLTPPHCMIVNVSLDCAIYKNPKLTGVGGLTYLGKSIHGTDPP